VIAFLANALWQPCLLALAALVIDALCRRAAANVRYWIAIAALAGAVAMPIVSAIPRSGGGSTGVAVKADLDASTARAITVAYLGIVAIAAVRLARRWRSARKLTAETIATPITVGVLEPRILIPRFLEDPDLVAAAVAHETAHIQRRDALVQLLVEIVSLPLALHPAAIVLKRRIAELREMACDELAATDRQAYAKALVAIASLARHRAPAGALAMATTSIERRIASLRTAPRRAATIAAATAFAIVGSLLFVAGCRNAVHPTVASNFSGTWTLDRTASRLGRPLAPYRAFEQTITHDRDRLTVRQVRTTAEGIERVAWSVTTDGVERPVDASGRGRARWQDRKLVLEMRDPGHTERAAAFLENGSLVIEGDVRNAARTDTYRAVFRRAQ
jgi:BlaR1 peptidase M56